MQDRDGSRSLRCDFRGRFRTHLAKLDVFGGMRWSHESETNSAVTIGQRKLMTNCYRFDKRTKKLNRYRIICCVKKDRRSSTRCTCDGLSPRRGGMNLQPRRPSSPPETRNHDGKVRRRACSILRTISAVASAATIRCPVGFAAPSDTSRAAA